MIVHSSLNRRPLEGKFFSATRVGPSILLVLLGTTPTSSRAVRIFSSAYKETIDSDSILPLNLEPITGWVGPTLCIAKSFFLLTLLAKSLSKIQHHHDAKMTPNKGNRMRFSLIIIPQTHRFVTMKRFKLISINVRRREHVKTSESSTKRNVIFMKDDDLIETFREPNYILPLFWIMNFSLFS